MPPSPRRGAALAPDGATHLILQGGYNGDQQLADCHALHLNTLTWRSITVAAPEGGAAAASRALHTLTPLTATRFLAVGGMGPAGPVSGLQILESPSIERGAALRRQLLAANAALAAARQRGAALASEARCCAARLVEADAEVASCKLRDDAEGKRAEEAVRKLRDCEGAQSKAERAEGRVRALELQVGVLLRRLERARAGGERAVQVAKDLEVQLHASGAGGGGVLQWPSSKSCLVWCRAGHLQSFFGPAVEQQKHAGVTHPL